jgi:hypothetical protein
VEDTKRRQAHIVMDISLPREFPGAEQACADGCEAEGIQSNDVMYTRSPLLAADLHGKTWMKLDLRRLTHGIGGPPGAFGVDPPGAAAYLRMLRATGMQVIDEGTDEVAGAEAKHYSVTVELRRVPDALPEGQRAEGRRRAERLIELTGQSEIPVDIWIDDQNRIRRLVMEQEIKQSGVTTRIQTAIEYVRFGVPVAVDPPDDDDAFDATDLTLKALEGQRQP